MTGFRLGGRLFLVCFSVLSVMTSLLTIGEAWAQKGQFIERVVENTTAEKNPLTAKRELFEKAIEKVSQDLVTEMIGEAKMGRNRSLISDKIMRKSGRFIPYSKPGDLVPIPEGFKMLVTLKINVDELQKLLRENGLLYESDSTPSVMPAIRWQDKINGREYAWWTGLNSAEDGGFLAKQSLIFESALRSGFAKQNFYVSRPQGFRMVQLLPKAFQTESLRIEDWQILGPSLHAQVVIDGQISVLKAAASEGRAADEGYRIEMRLTALQIMNGRVIAEVVRQFDTSQGPFEMTVDKKMREVSEAVGSEMANQVLDAWQRGAIGASLYRLTVRGRLPMNQQEVIKETFKSKLKELKSINERLISMDSIVYEIDSSLGPIELTKKIPSFVVGNYKLVLESANEKEAVYKAEREGGAQ